MDEKPFYYSCEHGSSNTPDVCQMRAWALTQPADSQPPQVMPDDWYLDYPSIPDGGMSDTVSIQ